MKLAIVLSGGGARAAYQAGVLREIAEWLPAGAPLPFTVVSGTSAGAINAAAIGAGAQDFRQATIRLCELWGRLRARNVYRTDAMSLVGSGVRWLISFVPAWRHRRPASLLDNAPLGRFLNRVAPFAGVKAPEKFVGFMLLLWTNDTGAYLVGRAIGRTKLMPKVSPKKTVEGLLGGIALTMLVGWLLARNWTVLSLHQWLACAAVVAVMATLGDLMESAFKRARGAKDSGTVLPGHGGILDRFDGFVLAAPGMWLTIHLLG